MSKDKASTEHLQAVRAWLDENIKVYPTPQSISISQISLDSKSMSGRALLKIGDDPYAEELTLRMGDTGRLTYSLPMFCSPLGAPASYCAISLTSQTIAALDKLIAGLLPRLLPLGLHPVTKEFITTSTPFAQRTLDPDQFADAFNLCTNVSFSLEFHLGAE